MRRYVCIREDENYIQLAMQLIKINYRDSPIYKSGDDGMFLRITDDIGVKLYQDKTICVNTYKRQFEASAYKLAPKVGSYFIAMTRDRKKMHCYITGAIKQTTFEYYKNMLPYQYGIEVSDKDEKVSYELRNKLESMRLANDCHLNNWGYDHKGTPVCIDFSR